MKRLLILILALFIFVAGCSSTPKAESSKKPLTQGTIGTFETFEFETFELVSTTTETTRQEIMVWIPRTGEKYHLSSICSGMKNPSYVTLTKAIQYGYEPCSKCYN
jgi:PBP1b-binding outer membrane lipoprotein LpoB